MKKGQRSIYTIIGLLMLACLLVVDRFVVELPDWAAIAVALASCVCIFIGFRKTMDKRSGAGK